MGAVDLDGVDARFDSTASGISEALHQPLDLGHRHLLRRRVPLVPGDRTRGPQVVGPTTNLGRGDFMPRRGDVPGAEGAGLAAGVGQLDADLLALRVNEIDDALERGDLAVLPQAAVLGRDAAVGGDGGGLDDGQGGAAQGEGPQVHQVPVRQVAVVGRVHAHRADGKPVLEGHAPEGERCEERGHLGARVEGRPGWGALGGGVEGDTSRRGACGELLDRHLGCVMCVRDAVSR